MRDRGQKMINKLEMLLFVFCGVVSKRQCEDTKLRKGIIKVC